MRSVHLKFFSFVSVSQIVGFLPPEMLSVSVTVDS